jgi:2-succinyl-5-enolpyruvyl-6-hydroxy-3-cyclohexene-1-carboxylate synthase
LSQDVQATFFATLADEWARHGVTNVVLAPGNRSSIFAVQLYSDDRFRTHVVVDERSASFLALGLAKESQGPTILWTTSGTAAVECHAAVVEADLGKVPLIVCTADRPVENRHVRDWQSIEQSRLFGDSLRWGLDPGVADAVMSKTWRSIASRAVHEATSGPMGPGPVHLNLPIREPWSFEAGKLPDSAAGPWHDLRVAPRLPEVRLPSGNGVLVAGEGVDDPAALVSLAEHLGLPLLADARSGARSSSSNVIASADLLCRSNAFCERNQADFAICFGAPSLSKRLGAWIANDIETVVFVDPYNDWSGQRAAASIVVAASPGEYANAVMHTVSAVTDGDWLASWRTADATVQRLLDSREAQLPAEVAVARAVVDAAPIGAKVFAATSMPVRDIETFGRPRADIDVFANRGASGMDGLVSTAVGIARSSSSPVAMLTGDLSFLYDIGALWSLAAVIEEVSLTVVVIDNNGGGIFSQLPQLESIDPAVFEAAVATPHNQDLASIVRGFGYEVIEASSVADVRDAVAGPQPGLRVVRIATQRDGERVAREQLDRAVIDALR